MPLDPQAIELLQELEEQGFRPNPSMTPEEMRGSSIQSQQTAPPPEVHHVEDLTIPGGDGQDMTVRVYQPTPSPEGAVVVYFHGGGWVICSIDTHDIQVRKMARLTGFTFVSVDYRLAPEHPFPAAAEDCYAALRWVSENAASLGVDASRLAVAGDSAGGNLAAAAALMARDRDGPSISYQLLVYPCCDSDASPWPSMEENANGPILTRDLMGWFVAHYAGGCDLTNAYLAPIRATDHSRLPPGLLITAEFDPLRDEGEAYAAKLQGSGVNLRLSRYDGLFHGFMTFTDRIALAATAQVEAANDLRAALSA